MTSVFNEDVGIELLYRSKELVNVPFAKEVVEKYNSFAQELGLAEIVSSVEYSKDFNIHKHYKYINVDEYINDPMCGFVVTNGLWLDLANGMIDVFEHKKYAGTDKGLRVFLISGSKDPVGQNGKGVSSLYKFLKDIFPNTSIDIIKNARHEVFSEKNKKDNYQKLIRFISS